VQGNQELAARRGWGCTRRGVLSQRGNRNWKNRGSRSSKPGVRREGEIVKKGEKIKATDRKKGKN